MQTMSEHVEADISIAVSNGSGAWVSINIGGKIISFWTYERDFPVDTEHLTKPEIMMAVISKSEIAETGGNKLWIRQR